MTRLYESQIIKVFGEIDDDLAREFISSIIEYSVNPTQEIMILINSDGGCIYSAFAMHDIMRHVDNPVLTIGTGRVMSAAALLLAAGDRRELMPNTTLMLHEPSISEFSASEELKVGDMGREFAHMDDLKVRMYRLLSKYTGRPLKSLTRDLEGRDFYLNAKEAKEYGIVDSIRQLKSITKVDPA